MKKLLLIFLTSLFGQFGFAQNNFENPSTNIDWLEMIQDPNVNFFEAQKVFNNYWEGRVDYKGNGWKVFKRWEYINESRVLPDGKLQATGHVKAEYDKYMNKIVGSKSAAGNWTIQGPTSYVGNNTSQPTGMGRINTIAFHPTDVNTIFVGSPSGGLWKTTNGGATWLNLSNTLATLGVSSILIHPTNPDIMYIGSGDRDADDALPMGVFKSTDGGINWIQINSTMGDVTVGAMLMHPTDPNTILAATSAGIYKTTDAGATWSLKSGANNYKDIQFKPGDPSVVYAVRITTPSRFYRSSDTGDSWTQVTSGIPTAGIGSRMVIGVSAANPNYVYLVQIYSADRTFANLLKSTNSGLSFASQSNSPNIFDYECDGSGTDSQATYDLCITVDPSNANTIFVGSINNWKSTDGGVNWSISSHWIGSNFSPDNPSSNCAASVHADQHCYGWSPLNGRLFVGHDGGINYTADGGLTWPEITNNLAITQIYKIGQSSANTDYTLIGCQDNGSAATTNSTSFVTTSGGDGMETEIDYNNSNYCYNSYVSGDIRRSTTGPLGSYTKIAGNTINGIDESGAWVSPYLLHKSNPNTMFLGMQNVWRSNNIRAVSGSSILWSKISTGEIDDCIAMDQSIVDVNILYVVRSGSIQRTDNANASDASVAWSVCSLLPGDITPTAIKAHPTDANIVYATGGYSVFKSIDKGLTWTDLDPNASLPMLFLNCLVYDKNSNEGIYIGNQTGVWYKNATMADWILFSNGLPPVDIRELEIFYDPVGTQNRLKAATYGRGLWQSDLYESGVLNPTSFAAAVSSNTQIDCSWALESGNNVMLAYNSSPTFGIPVNGTSYTTTIPGGGTVLYNGNNTLYNHTSLTSNTPYYYKIWSYDGATNYSSGSTDNATTTYSIANFTENNTISCNLGLTVNFTDASTAAYNSWEWDVDNDGITDYITQNPTHTYNIAGLYSVKLTINHGAANMIKENRILVMSSEPTLNTGCSLTSNSNNLNNFGIGIYRFALGSIDFTTSHNDGYYQNYTCAKWTALELNKSYNVTITTGTSNNEGAKVYIDYNDNGTFEAGEAVASFPANKNGTRTLSFTTPSAGVVLDKGLRLRVLSKFNSIPSSACDISSYGQAEDYTVYFINDATWVGAISADWNTLGNWSYNVVPTAGVNAIIPTGVSNYPVLAANISCNKLKIETGASVTVNPGRSLTVNGTLTNNGGNAGLVIKSDATGTGSLIHNSANVDATIERYLTGNSTTLNTFDFHLVSVPFNADRTASLFYGMYLYHFNQATQNFINMGSNPATVLDNNEGYMIFYPNSNTTANMTGQLNNGAFTALTGTDAVNEFSLVPNPYPSAINWDAVSGWTKTNLQNAFYIWDPVSNNYVTWASGAGTALTGHIPVGQSFFVKATASTPVLSMTNAVRLHSSQAFWKEINLSVPEVFQLGIGDTESSDKVIVRFVEGASIEHGIYDADKLNGSETAPQLYTLAGNTDKLTINALAHTGQTVVVPVGLEYYQDGELEFTATGIESFKSTVSIFLEDKLLYKMIDLKATPSYTFTHNTNDDALRFNLHFYGVNATNELTKKDYNIWSTVDHVNVHIPALTGKKAIIEIYDLLGHQVIAEQVDLSSPTTIAVTQINGMAIVKVISDNAVYSEKVFIQ